MHEKFYQTAGDSSFDDRLNLVIGSVGKVRNSPTSINENFIIERIDKLGQNWQRRKDLLESLAYSQ
jgi:hypothetical protein